MKLEGGIADAASPGWDLPELVAEGQVVKQGLETDSKGLPAGRGSMDGGRKP